MLGLAESLPLGYLVPRSGTGSRFGPLRWEECRRIKGAVPTLEALFWGALSWRSWVIQEVV